MLNRDWGGCQIKLGRTLWGKGKDIKREGGRQSKSRKFFIMRDHSSRADSGLLNNADKNKFCSPSCHGVAL